MTCCRPLLACRTHVIAHTLTVMVTSSPCMQAAFLRKNPTATVPVLDIACNGTLLETIPDSIAIVKRVERGDLGGKSLIPLGKEAVAWGWVDR